MSRAELLELTVRKHKSAVSKISRLRNTSNSPVELAGTKLDPRKDLKVVRRYTTKQLASYAERLDTFNDRKTRFYGDTFKRPLDNNLLNLYKERETAYNAKIKRGYDQVKDVKLPLAGQVKTGNITVDDRNKYALSDRKQAGNRTVNSKYNPPVRKPSQFKSNKSLEIMAGTMAKRLAPDFHSDELADQRRIVNDLLKIINKPELLDAVNKLSAKQFDVMWNHTKMPDMLKLPYLIMQKLIEDVQETQSDVQLKAVDNDLLESNLKTAGKWIEWASKLKLDG